MNGDKVLTAEQVDALIHLRINQVDLQRLEVEAGKAHRAYMEANDTLASARLDVARAIQRWEAVSNV